MNGPQGQLGVERMGEQLGPLAGWFKGGIISEGILFLFKGWKVRHSPRFFDQVGHQTTYASIEKTFIH